MARLVGASPDCCSAASPIVATPNWTPMDMARNGIDESLDDGPILPREPRTQQGPAKSG